MKKAIILILLLVTAYALYPQQANRADVLQDLERNQSSARGGTMTAVLKAASRLFADKDDLTSVIVLIPKGTIVTVFDYDDTYMHVVHEENEGYIYSKHAVLNRTREGSKPVISRPEAEPKESSAQTEQRISRFAHLENKYGTDIAARLYAGKIWKGMTAEMVNDSWGSPQKINRIISGNNVREEWIYSNSWLFIQNRILVEWGPVRK